MEALQVEALTLGKQSSFSRLAEGQTTMRDRLLPAAQLFGHGELKGAQGRTGNNPREMQNLGCLKG